MKKGDKNNFDDLMKNLLSKEGEVPPGLAWEEMDIDIPQKESKRRFFMLFFISGIVICLLAIGSYSNILKTDSNSTLETKVEQAAQTEKNQTQLTSDRELLNKSKDIQATNENESDIISDNTSRKTASEGPKKLESTDKIKTKKIANHQKTIISKSSQVKQTNKPELVKDRIPAGTKQKEIVPATETVIRISKVNSTSVQENKIAEKKHLEIQTRREVVSNNQVEAIPLLDVFNIERYQLEIDPRLLPEKRTALLSSVSTDSNKSDLGIYLMRGINLNQIKSQDNNELLGMVEAEPGLSLAFGFEKMIRPKLQVLLGINYQKIHTGFRVTTEEVSTDYFRNIETTTCTHIYRNNYSKILGLNIGLGRVIAISKMINLQANFAISPYYQLSISGLTMVDEEVIDLDNSLLENQFSLSLSPSLDFKYKLTDHFYARTSYLLNIPAMNDIMIHRAVSVKTNHQLLVGLSYLL